MERLTRRTLLGSAAAGAAATAASTPAGAATRAAARAPKETLTDVCVVGAGYAGLSAARAIAAAGRSVVVLEARDRVGGRVHSIPAPGGQWFDVGGQWVGPTQDRLLALTREVGIKTFKTYNTGENVYLRDGVRTRYATNGPLGAIPTDAGAPEAGAAIVALNDMAQSVPRVAPWKAGRAAEWDSMTFATWRDANVATPAGRFLLDVGIQSVFSVESRDISLLFVLFYIAAAGNDSTPGDFNRLLNVTGGAQEERFVGGAQGPPLKVAAALGNRVRLSRPVRRITDAGGALVVETDRGNVRAHRAIVAMAPAMCARIDYAPALGSQRDQLTQRYPMGLTIKCQAVYPKPFWRAEGLTGQAVGDADPVGITFDNSPPGGEYGVLLGFIEGSAGRRFSERPAPERKAAVLASFARYFGEQALKPTEYVERDWSAEEWSRGCYVGVAPPGVLLDYGEHLRKPSGRIHWAGTETATLWNGYMDGAIQSGERAAGEVLKLLPAGKPKRRAARAKARA